MTVRPLSTTLGDVCFLHWPYPESIVDRVTPTWVTPDAADESAWVSAVVVTMASVDVFGLPVREDVVGVNLRTYVRGPDDQRGVYFFSLDVTDRLVAETAPHLFHLPYRFAEIDRGEADGRFRVGSRRADGSGAALTATVEPSGEPRVPGPDTLPAFLVERSRYFTSGPMGTHLVGGVGHEPWAVAPASASASAESLLETAGFEPPESSPLAHYSPGIELSIGPPRPIRGPGFGLGGDR